MECDNKIGVNFSIYFPNTKICNIYEDLENNLNSVEFEGGELNFYTLLNQIF